MDDELERMAEAIHKENPVAFEGLPLNWEHVTRSHPERAAEYREAARNRLKADEAMKRLADVPERASPDPQA